MERTATQQGAAGMGQLTIATGRVPGDQIIVTLTATKPSKERVSISEVFDYQGVNIDNAGQPTGRPGLTFGAQAGGAQPVFPLEAYKNALVNKNEDVAASLVKGFRTSLEEFQRNGGSTEAERIASAVYSYLERNHGVSAQDGDHLILKRESVVARAPTRASANEPGVWLIQLAPTWGTR